MINAAPYYIPAELFSPPAIMQSYETTNKSIHNNLFFNGVDSSRIKEGYIKLDSKLIRKFIAYEGFEIIINSYNNCKEDAISRYKKVYKTDNYDIEPIEPFFNAIKSIVHHYRIIPRLSFYPDGALAMFIIQQKEITIEYDFDDPESVLISKFINDILHIKEATISNLNQLFGAFL